MSEKDEIKDEVDEETILVNREAFNSSIEALHIYHGELIANMEVAIDEGWEEEWLEDLQFQIDVIKLIYDGFNSSVDGWDSNFGDDGNIILN